MWNSATRVKCNPKKSRISRFGETHHTNGLMTWRTLRGRCMAFSRSLTEIWGIFECVWMTGCSVRNPRMVSCIFSCVFPGVLTLAACDLVIVPSYSQFPESTSGTKKTLFLPGTWSRRLLEWSAVFHQCLEIAGILESGLWLQLVCCFPPLISPLINRGWRRWWSSWSWRSWWLPIYQIDFLVCAMGE